MLCESKELRDFVVLSRDGDVGTIDDIYWEDQGWPHSAIVRYFVLKIGNRPQWLGGRKVLLPPVAIGGVDWDNSALRLNLSREQVEHSPDIDTALPVSRQKELEFYSYYGWSPYWGHPTMWPRGDFPNPLLANDPEALDVSGYGDDGPVNHLRSLNEVLRYRIHAQDGEFGHVKDFIIDTDSWAVRYLVIDTVNWWPSKSVLMALNWISEIDWSGKSVHTSLSSEAIKSSPVYQSDQPISREYEHSLHIHYGEPGYWDVPAPGILQDKKTG